MKGEIMTEASHLEDGADYIIDEDFNDISYYKDTHKLCKNGLYRCTRCGQYKPKSEFYKDNRIPCGIRSKCKQCYHKKSKKGNT